MKGDLRVEALTVAYGTGPEAVRPLDRFAMLAPAGAITLLLGPSGSGKTTLLSVFGGLLTPSTGTVRLGDMSVTDLTGPGLVRYRRDTVGFVFQSFNLIPSLSARENIAVPLLVGGARRREALRAADAVIDVVGLRSRADHRPHQLSGGEKQRVAIGRGLVADPDLLLADEPTANLDERQTDEILRLLRGLRDNGRCIVMSSHDPRTLAACDHVVTMGAGISPTKSPSSSRPPTPNRL